MKLVDIITKLEQLSVKLSLTLKALWKAFVIIFKTIAIIYLIAFILLLIYMLFTLLQVFSKVS